LLDIIISDVNRALDAEAYLSALALMMTIPDICSKIEYGDSIQRTGDRYIAWFDEYIGKYQRLPEEKVDTPFLSGEIAYQLRCAILHEGKPDVDKSKIKEAINQIDGFTLLVQKKNPFDIYADSSMVVYHEGSTNGVRSYEINVRGLWVKMESAASAYYNLHKDEFDAMRLKIDDVDRRVEILERMRNYE